MILEVPDDDTAPADHGRVMIIAPLPGPYREVSVNPPVDEVLVPRGALALVLQYAYHVAMRNPDVQLKMALAELSERHSNG